MKQYLQAIFPADFKHNKAFWRAFVLGVLLLTLALFQLFQFEDFPGIIEDMRLPGGGLTAAVLAALLPFMEIASLPYLFSMRIPKVLRIVSLGSCVLLGLLWLILTVSTSLRMGDSVGSGIFGATLATSSGGWSVVFSILLLWSIYLTVQELPKRRVK